MCLSSTSRIATDSEMFCRSAYCFTSANSSSVQRTVVLVVIGMQKSFHRDVVLFIFRPPVVGRFSGFFKIYFCSAIPDREDGRINVDFQEPQVRRLILFLGSSVSPSNPPCFELVSMRWGGSNRGDGQWSPAIAVGCHGGNGSPDRSGSIGGLLWTFKC
jgi:hypothetical protein